MASEPMTDEDQAIVPSWEDVANRWERAYNEVCEERDALVAEVRRLRAERRQHWNRWDPTNASDAT